MKCPRCKGEGWVEETINTGDGMSPNRDVPVECFVCDGKGTVPDDFEDWDDFTEEDIDETSDSNTDDRPLRRSV